MTRYVDVTVPLIAGQVTLYPGDTELEVTRVQARDGGRAVPTSRNWCAPTTAGLMSMDPRVSSTVRLGWTPLGWRR
jgi:hypothetical protein